MHSIPLARPGCDAARQDILKRLVHKTALSNSCQNKSLSEFPLVHRSPIRVAISCRHEKFQKSRQHHGTKGGSIDLLHYLKCVTSSVLKSKTHQQHVMLYWFCFWSKQVLNKFLRVQLRVVSWLTVCKCKEMIQRSFCSDRPSSRRQTFGTESWLTFTLISLLQSCCCCVTWWGNLS